jgi:hypothetical protein
MRICTFAPMHNGTMTKCKVVLTATTGMADFLDNCLSGMDLDSRASEVCVVVPDEQADDFEDLKAEYGFELATLGSLIEAADQKAFSRDYASYGTPDFSALMALRMPLLRKFLETNDYVLFSDIDVAWIRNPFSYLERVLDHCGVAMQTEASELYPPPFCMGFMAFKSGVQAFALLDWFQAAYEADRSQNPTATMQVTFNRILKDEPERARQIFPLPEALFPNGRLHRMFLRHAEGQDLAQLPEPFIFHANWTIGADAKRQMLRRLGMWRPRLHGDDQSYMLEIERLRLALKEERQRAGDLAEVLASQQAQIDLLGSHLSERTSQAEKLLSHVTAAYAEIEALKVRLPASDDAA